MKSFTNRVAGLIRNMFSFPNGVSKHAVVALSESMHLELMNKSGGK